MASESLRPLPGVLPAAEIAAMRQRLLAVRSRIDEAARLAGRDPEAITLVGVSKFFPAEMARAAFELGLADLGENRVQELIAKIDMLDAAGLHPNWHLIGTLQKNKVRQIIGRTHLIHSVDSLALLSEIDQRSQAAQLVTDVLLQVNTAGEASKHGLGPDETPAAAECAHAMTGIRLRGLMTMAPLFDDPDDTLPVFSATRELFERIAATTPADGGFDILSMGMSHDFIQAIRCGATHIRIGTAIFGPRL